jgi:hypothetical protein
MSSVIHWVNLTNGLQAIKDYNLQDYRIMRLQSTHCEQKRFEDILVSVPDEFLFYCAVGKENRVYDYGANKPIPRAIWQGLAWVNYAITRHWTGTIIEVRGRSGHMMNHYFDELYNSLSDKSKNRMRYYKTFSSGMPNITPITSSTHKDGDKSWFLSCYYDPIKTS